MEGGQRMAEGFGARGVYRHLIGNHVKIGARRVSALLMSEVPLYAFSYERGTPARAAS